jgi:phosphopantetheine adenylyltransferase
VRINDTEDPRKAWASVKQRMEVLRTAGKPVPEVLIKVERQLMADCMAESQGR